MLRRALLTGLGAAGIAAAGACTPPRPPSDREMLAFFRGHRPGFLKLRDAVRELVAMRDLESLRVDADPSSSATRTPWEGSIAAQLGTLGLESVSGGLSRVSFVASATGIMVSGTVKGYQWSASSPHPVVQRLERPYPPAGLAGGRFEGYRAIEPGWYLWLSRN